MRLGQTVLGCAREATQRRHAHGSHSLDGRVANSDAGRRMGCARPWFSRFVNLRETEAEREQPVLLAHRPGARKAKALAQPQHGFEALDGAPRCVEGLEAAHPRHGPLDPEVIALDPLLQVLGDVMHRGARQEPVFPGCRNGGRIGPRTIGADPVRREQRLIFQRLAEEALGGLQIALRREEEINRGAVLVDGPVQIPPLAANLDVCLIDPDWACRKLWRGAQDGLRPTPVSHFVNLWKTEAEREQPVLLADGPRAGKAETLTQPQHRKRRLGSAFRSRA